MFDACTHAGTYPKTHTDRQTDRQTDRKIDAHTLFFKGQYFVVFGTGQWQ